MAKGELTKPEYFSAAHPLDNEKRWANHPKQIDPKEIAAGMLRIHDLFLQHLDMRTRFEKRNG
jgi:hypothetical protein